MEIHKIGLSQQPAVDFTKDTLDKVLDLKTEIRPEDTFQDYITKYVKFVAVTGSLADAKRAMESIEGSQDVMVTASGQYSEAIIGWITNVEIVKVLQP